MFTSVAAQAPVRFFEPWHQPLHARLKMLARGHLRIAYFYESANNSTFRYRAYNMAQVLNDAPGDATSAGYFFLEDLHRLEEMADLAHTLVICRSRYCHRINTLVTAFRRRGKRVLFDIDDLVFDTRYAHLVIHTLDQDVTNPQVWDDWFATVSRLGETLRLCDGVITTNDTLAARISAFSPLPVRVVPNFINREQLALSEALYQGKVDSGFARDGRIRLGYFSGSPSHNRDYALITSALEQVLEDDPRLELVLVGYIEAGPALRRFGHRIRREPFQDYVNLQRLIGSTEFNLMPLQSNAFTHCKSELKYFEAAIVGTLSIASPTDTYTAAIEDGKNGYLAQAHQWATVIRRAVDRMADYPCLAAQAQTHARSKYAWDHQRDTLLRALMEA